MTDSENKDEEGAPWDLLSNALGSLDDLEDDPESIEVTESFEGEEEDDGFVVTSLGSAENLLKIRKAADDVKSGAITTEKFTAILRPMTATLKQTVELFESEAMVSQFEELPEEQYAVLQRTQETMPKLYQALILMANYKNSGSVEELDSGMEQLQALCEELVDIQVHATEVGQ